MVGEATVGNICAWLANSKQKMEAIELNGL